MLEKCYKRLILTKLMMRILSGIFKISLMMVLFSCHQPVTEFRDYTLDRHLQMLQGTWATTELDGYVEHWQSVDDTLLIGGGFLMVDDTLRQTEKLSIVYQGGQLVYLATVPDQNDGKVIAFPLKLHDDSTMTFTNPRHDFPNVISYHFITDSSLWIEVKSLTDPARDFVIDLKKTDDSIMHPAAIRYFNQ